MTQYSTKMIFAVLDVSLIMGLNIGETDKVFFTLIELIVVFKNVRRARCETMRATDTWLSQWLYDLARRIHSPFSRCFSSSNDASLVDFLKQYFHML